MWFFALVGAVLLGLGWGAYAGWNRRWLSRPLIYRGYLGPALVPMGIGFVLMGAAAPLGAALTPASGPTSASGIAWSLAFFGGLALVLVAHLMGTSGMPARWRPGWVRELEGLAPRHGDPAPPPGQEAPEWSTLAAGVESGPDGHRYRPPLALLPQRSVQAVVNAPWGGARSRQKDPEQLELLQRLGLLDGRLRPTPAGALLVARLYREDASTRLVEAIPPGRRTVVVTVVDRTVAVLEFRQDWGHGTGAGHEGLGGFDVVPYSSDAQVGSLMREWITAG